MFGDYGDTSIGADGSGIYTTTYGNRDQLVAWILGLGAEARVEEPADLRDAVVAALELVAERHQVDGGRSTPSAAPAAVPDPADAAEQAAAGAAGPRARRAGRALRPPPRPDDPAPGRLRRVGRGPDPDRRAPRLAQPRQEGPRGRHRAPQPHQLRRRLLRALRAGGRRHRRRAEGDLRRQLRAPGPALPPRGQGAPLGPGVHRGPPARSRPAARSARCARSSRP